MPSASNPIRFEDQAFVVALANISERIRHAPDDDQADLRELTAEFLDAAQSRDQERQQSAAAAILEILDRRPMKIVPITVPEDDDSLHEFNVGIGNRIKRLRASAQMTQEQLAAKAGIGQGYISKLEAGQHSPNALTIERIALALGVDVPQLYGTAQ